MNLSFVQRLIRFLVIFIVIMSLILAAELAIIREKNKHPGTSPRGTVYHSEVI